MKTEFCIGLLLLAGTIARAQTSNLTALLQQGLFEEQANRNLDAAIADYQNLALQFDKDRQLAATAIFRLGECYRAQGRTNEAAAEYQRIVRDFSDQQTLATLSRQNLLGMGAASSAAAATAQIPAVENPDVQLWNKLKDMNTDELAKILPTVLPDSTLDILLQQRNEAQAKLAQIQLDYSSSNIVFIRQAALLKEIGSQIDEKIKGMMAGLKLRAELSPSVQTATDARRQQKDLLQKQIDLAEHHLGTIQKLIQTGQAAPAQIDAAQSEVLRLRQQLAALDAVRPDLVNSAAPASSEEDKEIARIQQMIQNSPDLINAPGSGELGGAANAGELRVATFLLDHGADVNAKSGGDIPLNQAAMNAHKTMVELLINRGADVNARGSAGGSALLTATGAGYQAVVEVLLAHKADANAQYTKVNNEKTALDLAANLGHLNLVNLLLATGANPNLKDSEGRASLNYAIANGSPEIVKALLTAGADVALEDSGGRTVLSYAAERITPSATKLLLDAKADPNGGKMDPPLFTAIRQGNTNTLELLLRAGANANQPRAVDFQIQGSGFNAPQGGTVSPLRFAILQNKPEAVSLLLRFKADPNADDGWWFGEPLMFDALPHLDILQAMLDAGADPNPPIKIKPNRNDRGVSPLMTVMGSSLYQNPASNVAAARMLLAHGANPNFKDQFGQTALHYAVQMGNSELVKLLLDNKADPNAVDNNGITPLTTAKGKQNNNPAIGIPAGRPGSPLSYQWNMSIPNVQSAGSSNASATDLVSLLHQYGALDNLPDWNRITYSRPANNYSAMVFQKNTNDWNHFTLLELLFCIYPNGNSTWFQGSGAFPDLTRIVVVRPATNGVAKRIAVNLLTGTNSVDCTRDVPLEFGDVVEIPEREHTLAEGTSFLSGDQEMTILNFFRDRAGEAKLVVAGGQTVQLPLQPFYSQIGQVLNRDNARAALTSSSDLSRVKVTRRDSRTGITNEWILDCRDERGTPDLWLRAGDVIEVPLKP